MQLCKVYRELHPACVVAASPLHAHSVVALGHVERGIRQVENADVSIVVLRAVASTSLFSEHGCPNRNCHKCSSVKISASEQRYWKTKKHQAYEHKYEKYHYSTNTQNILSN